ncbi:MAG: biopolymer transporter ExbD [Acidobacteria bacterium]|nr:MAG: biopolymer transporter ExbD [Acidobacteriota bacterium]
MLYRKKRDRGSLIDLSPLIDVVFLLLIFFMVSTTFKEDYGMDLTLPEASSVKQQAQDDLGLWVNESGQIFVNGTQVKLSELESYLKEKAGEELAEKTVTLNIDRGIPHGRVVKIMDAVKSAGAKGIAFSAKGVQSSLE